MSKLIIFGANGYVGSRIADEARHRGHQVTEVSRNAGTVTGSTSVHQRDSAPTFPVSDSATTESAAMSCSQMSRAIQRSAARTTPSRSSMKSRDPNIADGASPSPTDVRRRRSRRPR